MKRLLALALIPVGCGAVEIANNKTKASLRKVNTYLDDRATAIDKKLEATHRKVRGYAIDRHLNLPSFYAAMAKAVDDTNEYIDIRTKALDNKSEDGAMKVKGKVTMILDDARNGGQHDMDEHAKVASNAADELAKAKSEVDARLEVLEARTTLIEDLNTLQSQLIDLQAGRISALEASDTIFTAAMSNLEFNLQSQIDGNLASQEEINAAQAQVNGILGDSIGSLTEALALLTDRVSAAEGNLEAQGVIISGIQDDVSTLFGKVYYLKHKLYQLKGQLYCTRNELDNLINELFGCGGVIGSILTRLDDAESDINELQADEDLVCSVSLIETEVCVQDKYGIPSWMNRNSCTMVEIPEVTCPE